MMIYILRNPTSINQNPTNIHLTDHQTLIQNITLGIQIISQLCLSRITDHRSPMIINRIQNPNHISQNPTYIHHRITNRQIRNQIISRRSQILVISRKSQATGQYPISICPFILRSASQTTSVRREATSVARALTVLPTPSAALKHAPAALVSVQFTLPVSNYIRLMLMQNSHCRCGICISYFCKIDTVFKRRICVE